MAVYALARGFAGMQVLIWIGLFMTLFPIFFAVIENDLRRGLAYSLNNKLGFRVVISGSEPERTMIGSICAKSRIKVNQVAGETDLRTLAAVLSLATVVVANSTGPLHLAMAVGTKVVGLYPGKKVTSPKRWGPLGEDHRVIQPPQEECHCPPKQCRCMESIKVDEVADQVVSLFTAVTAEETVR